VTVAEEELLKAVNRTRQAKEMLRKAKVPIQQGKIETLQRALNLVEREWDVQRKNLEISRRTKHGQLEAHRLELANLELLRDDAVVRAPADGIVTAVNLRVGDIAEPGEVGVTTVRQRGLEFEVTVANADVALLRPGLPVEIKLDAYDFQRYGVLTGTLQFVAPDSEVTEGPNGRQVAIYKAKISLHQEELVRGELRSPVKLGMTGRAEIVTDRESILLLLAKKIRQSVSLT
jgi:multidrug resistance efflux pump